MSKLLLKCTLLLTLIIPIAYSPDASANANTLGQCMVDNLNGKERKFLARWVFFAMGTHPEIKKYSNATEQDIQASNVKTGKLFNRLLTEDCPKELAVASQIDRYAIEKAFELVGQVAMQELITDPSVNQALTGYVEHTDLEAIQDIMSGNQ